MRHLTYANVVSTVCLFIVLGGSAYAAARLPRNSVGTAQIRNGAVKAKDLGRNAVGTSKVKNGSLLARDFKRGQLMGGSNGRRGATGKTGPRGKTGLTGKTGARGTTAASKIVMRQGGAASIGAGASGTAEASCASGERATGGGVYNEAGAVSPAVVSSYPTPNPVTPPATGNGRTPTGWRVRLVNGGATAASVNAYVVCASP